MSGFDFTQALRGTADTGQAFDRGVQRAQADQDRQRAIEKAEYDRQLAEQSRSAMADALRTGNYADAAAQAYRYGNNEAGAGLYDLNKHRDDRADKGTTSWSNVVGSIASMPYEQRRAAIEANAPVLARLGGVSMEEIAAFDPTDDNVRAIASLNYNQEMRVDDAREDYNAESTRMNATTNRIEAENPIVVGENGALVTRDGQTLYQAPTIFTAGLDENVYERGGTSSSGVTSNISMTQSSNAMATALAGQGFSAPVVAGILANAQHESGFDPRASGDSGSAHGYFQHRNERVTNFQRVIGVHPSQATPEQAARFVGWELNNPEAAGMTPAQAAAIKNSKTPAEAAMNFQRFYERPKNIDPARGATANGYAQSFSRSSTVEGQRQTTRPITQVQQGERKPTAAEITAQGGGKPLLKSDNEGLRKSSDQLREFRSLGRTFKDDYAGNSVTGGLENTIQGVVGNRFGTPGQSQWWSAFRTQDNLIRNSLFGASLTAGEKEAYAATTINPRMAPSEVRANIARRTEIMEGAAVRYAQSLIAGGYSGQQVSVIMGGLGLDVGIPNTGGSGTSAPSGHVNALRQNPSPQMRQAFDRRYGAGASARALGGR